MDVLPVWRTIAFRALVWPKLPAMARPSWAAGAALLAVCALFGCSLFVDALRPEQVVGAVKNEMGHYQISFKGKNYAVFHDEQHDRIYYVDPDSRTASWNDPRSGAAG